MIERVEINEVIIDNFGKPVTGAALEIRDEPADTLAIVYQAASGVPTLGQPLASTNGQFDGWLPEGNYKFTFSGSGLDTTVKNISLQKARPNMMDLADVDPMAGTPNAEDTWMYTATGFSFLHHTPGVMRVKSAAAAGENQLALDVVSGLIVPHIGVLIVKPYNGNCEVHTITARAGDIITLADNLLFNIDPDTIVMYRDSHTYHMLWFGIDPTGATDIGPGWQACLNRGGAGKVIETPFGTTLLCRTPVFDNNPSTTLFTKYRTENTTFKLDTTLPTVQDWDDDATALGWTQTGVKCAYFINVDGRDVSAGGGYDTAANHVYCDAHDATGDSTGPKRRPRETWEEPSIDGSLVPEPGAGLAYVNHHGARCINPHLDYAVYMFATNKYCDGMGIIGGGSVLHPRARTQILFMHQPGDSVTVEGVTGNGSGVTIGPSHGVNLFGRIAFQDRYTKTYFGRYQGHSEGDNRSMVDVPVKYDQAIGYSLGGQYNPPDVAQNTGPGLVVFDYTSAAADFGILGETAHLMEVYKTNYKNGDGVDPQGTPHYYWNKWHKNAKHHTIWAIPFVTVGGAQEGSGLWYAASADASVAGLQAVIDSSWILHDPHDVVNRNGAYEIVPTFGRLINCRFKTRPASMSVTANSATDGGSIPVSISPNHYYVSYVAWICDEMGNPSDYVGPVGVESTGNGVIRVRFNIKSSGTLFILRGHSTVDQASADAAVLAAPEMMFKFQGVRLGDFGGYDTGLHMNKKPGTATPSPTIIPAGNHTTSCILTDNGPIWPKLKALATSDFVRASTDGAGSVPGLSIAVEAYSYYEVAGLIVYDATAVADMRMSWALPAGGSDGNYQRGGIGTNASSQTGQAIFANTAFSGSGSVGGAGSAPLGTGNRLVARPYGIIKTGPNSGNIQLQVQQDTPDATAPLTVYASLNGMPSFITAQCVGKY